MGLANLLWIHLEKASIMAASRFIVVALAVMATIGQPAPVGMSGPEGPRPASTTVPAPGLVMAGAEELARLLALEEGKARVAEQVEDTIPTTVEVGLQFVTIINMLGIFPIRKKNFSNSQISLTRVDMKKNFYYYFHVQIFLSIKHNFKQVI